MNLPPLCFVFYVFRFEMIRLLFKTFLKHMTAFQMINFITLFLKTPILT